MTRGKRRNGGGRGGTAALGGVDGADHPEDQGPYHGRVAGRGKRPVVTLVTPPPFGSQLNEMNREKLRRESE